MISYRIFKNFLKDAVLQRKLEGVNNIFIDDRKILSDYIENISREKCKFKMLKFIPAKEMTKVRNDNIFNMDLSEYIKYIIYNYDVNLDILINYIEETNELEIKIIIDSLWELIFNMEINNE